MIDFDPTTDNDEYSESISDKESIKRGQVVLLVVDGRRIISPSVQPSRDEPWTKRRSKGMSRTSMLSRIVFSDADGQMVLNQSMHNSTFDMRMLRKVNVRNSSFITSKNCWHRRL
jgi:hypothetical protein